MRPSRKSYANVRAESRLSHARRPAVVEAQSAADAAMKVFEERAPWGRAKVLAGTGVGLRFRGIEFLGCVGNSSIHYMSS